MCVCVCVCVCVGLRVSLPGLRVGMLVCGVSFALCVVGVVFGVASRCEGSLRRLPSGYGPFVMLVFVMLVFVMLVCVCVWVALPVLQFVLYTTRHHT